MKIVHGNIFTSKVQTLVNTVNCVGVMGAGIALEFRLRYPEMYFRYQELCEKRTLDIGTLWLFKASDRWVLNFPTKRNWKQPSRTEYLHSGLRKFLLTHKEKGIESVAFPVLGSDKGGIGQAESLRLMESYLKQVEISVEVYTYDPQSGDDLFQDTKAWVLNQTEQDVIEQTGIRRRELNALLGGFKNPKIRQLNQLAKIPGIGIKTLERVFHLAQDRSNNPKGALGGSVRQGNLFK